MRCVASSAYSPALQLMIGTDTVRREPSNAMPDISVDAFESRLLASIFLLTEGRDIGRLRLVCKGWQQNIDDLQVHGIDLPHPMALDMRSSLYQIHLAQVFRLADTEGAFQEALGDHRDAGRTTKGSNVPCKHITQAGAYYQARMMASSLGLLTMCLIWCAGSSTSELRVPTQVSQMGVTHQRSSPVLC